VGGLFARRTAGIIVPRLSTNAEYVPGNDTSDRFAAAYSERLNGHVVLRSRSGPFAEQRAYIFIYICRRVVLKLIICPFKLAGTDRAVRVCIITDEQKIDRFFCRSHVRRPPPHVNIPFSSLSFCPPVSYAYVGPRSL